MINAWKLLGEAPRKPGWTNVQKEDIYKNGYNVTKSSPFGVDDTPTDYSTSLRPNTAQQRSAPLKAAGSSGWAV